MANRSQSAGAKTDLTALRARGAEHRDGPERDQPLKPIHAHRPLAAGSTLGKRVTGIVAAIALTISFVAPASAQVTINLVVSPDTISFPDANPTTTPSIMANTVVDIGVQVISSSDVATPWSASALSNGDLQSGPDTIAISNVTWTSVEVSATPCGACTCLAGTASSVASQLMFTGAGGHGSRGVQVPRDVFSGQQLGVQPGELFANDADHRELPIGEVFPTSTDRRLCPGIAVGCLTLA